MKQLDLIYAVIASIFYTGSLFFMILLSGLEPQVMVHRSSRTQAQDEQHTTILGV